MEIAELQKDSSCTLANVKRSRRQIVNIQFDKHLL